MRPEDASAALHSGQSGAAFRASEGGDFAGKKEVAGATAAPVLTSSSERSALASAKTLVDTSEAHHVSLDAMTHTPQSKHAKQQSFKLTPGTRGHAGELDALAGDSKSDSAGGATQDGASVSMRRSADGSVEKSGDSGHDSKTSAHSSHARGRHNSSTPWEKVLWRRQPYPDNFVHTTFCDSVRNTRGHNLPFDYWTMVRHTAVLMQQLCVVVIFSTVFRLALIEDAQSEPRPDTPSISLPTLLHIDAFVIVLLYAIYAVLSKQVPPTPNARPHMLAEPQRLLLFLVLLMAVSPVLHTLTKTYASDTIYLLAVLLGTVHVFSYDFTYMLNMSREFKGTVSMNAALLCSILLASRLSSNLHCFGLMCFAVELFSLSPILWHMLRMYSTNVHAAFTAAMVVSVSVLLALTHRRIFGFLFVFAAVVIPFVAPLVFLRVQRFKVRIAGPWDLGGVNPVEDK